MFTSCAGIDVLTPYTLVKLVDEHFKNSDQKTIYIDTEQEPFKTIEENVYKNIHENTILWHGLYFIKEGKEYLFDQKCLKPLSAGFEQILIDEFSEYNNVAIVFRTFVYDENDFLNLKTIEDLEILLKNYRKIIKSKYKEMMWDLLELASA